MRRIHLPDLLEALDEARAGAFIVLFTIDAACRSLLISIVPLQAFDLLGSAQTVSLLYFTMSIAGLVTSLTLPVLLHVVGRRWLMTAALLAYVLSCALFASGNAALFALGLGVQIVGGAALEVVINLYLLDQIPRRDLNVFEPRRLFYSGGAFVLGPWLGVFLHYSVAPNLTYALVAVLSLVFLAIFWRLRLSAGSAITAQKTPPPRPLRFVPRFATQPRLVLAWVLAVGRSGWWLMYFVYTPILVTTSGYSPEMGGALVSLGVLPMLLIRVWAGFGARYGIRRLLIAGYGLTGIVSVVAGILAAWPLVVMGLLSLAAFCATMIDGAGNVPFLRAVHPHERAPMTAVFMTFRHASSLLIPGIFALVLAVLPLPFVFITSGMMTIAMAGLCRYLPRTL